MTDRKQPHYPVTELEMRQIQNDCKYPDMLDCEGCPSSNDDTGCDFGANLLIDEILTRPVFSHSSAVKSHHPYGECPPTDRCPEIDCDTCRGSHSSAAEPAKGVSCLTCFHCHKQVSTYHKGLVFRGTAICPECTDKYGENDATIAQAAREEVLDAVKEHCQKGIFNMNQCVVNDTRGNPIEEVHTQRADERRETYKDIIRFSQSLRSGGK